MAEHVYKNNNTWSVEQGSIAPQLDYNRKPKYIVKNCPCNVTTEDMCDWGNTNETYCQDCTDCLIKQIYEMCKSQKESYCSFTVAFLADRILRLFDIEEINK